MSAYAYKLRVADGSIERGVVEATGQNEAIQKVKRLGGVVVEVKPAADKKELKISLGGNRVSLKDRIIFTEQISVMLKAGITLLQALKGLSEESTNRKLAKVIDSLIADVEGGMPFSEALSKHPGVFSNIYCQMVASAEKSGNLSEVLNRLTTQQQKEYELRGKVRGALMYPAIISVLLIGVVIMVITFILPKLSGLFADSGASLPASTKLLLAISFVFTHYWYLILIGAVVAVVGSRFALRTKPGAYFWDSLKIRLPIIGGFIRKSYIARFAQSFAALAQAGVPVLEVFKTLEGVVGNIVYQNEIKRIANDVENGIKVSTAIRKSRYFPAMVGQLVSVGEQSGDLAGIFNVLGDFFEKEVDGIAKNLSTLLEPIIMIVMGIGVAFVLISVLQPIFNLSNSF